MAELSRRTFSRDTDTSDNKGDFRTGVDIGIQGAIANFNGFAALVADELGNEAKKKEFLSNVQQAQEKAANLSRDRISSTGDISSVGDAVDFAQLTLGQLAPFAVETLASGLSGGVAGFAAKTAVKAAIKDVAKGVADDATKNAVSKFLKKALDPVNIGSKGAIAATNQVQGIGEVFADTGDKEQALKKGPLIGLADIVSDISILSGLKGGAKTIKGAVAGVGKTSVAEGGTELIQESLLQAAKAETDPNFDPDSKEARTQRLDAFIAGMLGGGVASGVTTTVGQIRKSLNKSQELRINKAIDDIRKQGKISRQDSSASTPVDAVDDKAPFPVDSAEKTTIEPPPAPKPAPKAEPTKVKTEPKPDPEPVAKIDPKKVKVKFESVSDQKLAKNDKKFIDALKKQGFTDKQITAMKTKVAKKVNDGLKSLKDGDSLVIPQVIKTAKPAQKKKVKTRPQSKSSFQFEDTRVSSNLPSSLSKSRPRFNIGQKQGIPQFESDIDKALFITSQKKKSKQDRKFRNFLLNQGFTDQEINQAGTIIRSKIKDIALKSDDEEFNVPKTFANRLLRSKVPTRKQTGEAANRIIQAARDESGFITVKAPKKLEDFAVKHRDDILNVARKARALAKNSFAKFRTQIRRFVKSAFQAIKPILRDLFDRTGDVVTTVLLSQPFSLSVVSNEKNKASVSSGTSGKSSPASTSPPAVSTPKPQPVSVGSRPSDISKEQWSKLSDKEQKAVSKAGVIPEKKSLKDKLAQAKNFISASLVQGIFDKYRSLMLLDIAAMDLKKFGDIKSRPTLLGKSSYIMARMSGTAQNAVTSMFMYGKLAISKSGALTVNTDKEGLTRAIDKFAPGDRLPIFLRWLAGKRAELLLVEDRENLFTKEDIEVYNELAKPHLDDFKKLEKIWTDYNNSVLDIAQRFGLVDKEAAKLWKERGPYLPFYRILEADGELAGPADFGGLAGAEGIKALKGGKERVGDLFENAVRNWHHLLSSSLANRAALQSLQNAQKLDIAHPIKNPPKNAKNVVWVWDRGKKQHWQIEDSAFGNTVVDSLLGMQSIDAGKAYTKIFRRFKRIHVTGVTINPAFKIANLIRDSLQTVIVSQFGGKSPFQNAIDGWRITKSGSPESLFNAQLYTAGGQIDFGYLFGDDPETSKQLLKRGVDPDTVLNKPTGWDKFSKAIKLDSIKAGFNKYQDLGNRLENVNRVGTAKNVFDKTAKKSDDNTGNLMLAAFESRDLMDFGLTGSYGWVRQAANAISFFNARLQGIYRLARGATEGDSIKVMGRDLKFSQRFAAITGSYALASLGIFLLARDEEKYKRLPEWEKMTYHHFFVGGQHFRLPRPFELGAIGSMVESSFDLFFGTDTDSKLMKDRILFTLTETLNLGVFPQMIKPGIEIMADRNFFTDAPIEGIALKRLMITERSQPWTSALAIGLSKATAPFLPKKSFLGVREASPVQIDHLAYSYLGWLGGSIMATTDMILRNMTSLPDRPALSASQWPVTGRFYRGSDPQARTHQGNQFWEMHNEVEQLYATINELRKQRRFEQAADLAIKNRDKLAKRGILNSMRKQLQDIRKRRLAVDRDPRMSRKQKKLLKNNLLESANRVTDNINKLSK